MRCAHGEPGARHLLIAAVHGPRDPEVHELDHIRPIGALAKHDVVGLDVAVQHVQVVRRLQGVGGLSKDISRNIRMQRKRILQLAGQRVPIHVLHRQVHHAIRCLTKIEYGRDIGVRQLTRVLRFAGEPLQRFDVAHQRRTHDLDRALALHAHMFAEIHLAHAAFADARDDTIALRDHGADQVGNLAASHQARAIGRAEGDRVVVRLTAAGADFRLGHAVREGGREKGLDQTTGTLYVK